MTTASNSSELINPKEKAKSFKLKPPGIRSIGSRLFIAVLLGSLAGLGALGYFFYQTLEKQAKDEMQVNLESKVNKIEAQFDRAKQNMADLYAAVKLLDSSGIREPKIYENLAFEFFQKRPELAVAVGFGQPPNRIIKDRKGFWPYFTVDLGQSLGKLLPPPNQKTRYIDLVTDSPANSKEGYFAQGYYKEPMATAEPFWLEPYPWQGITLTTFNFRANDAQGKVLGIFATDVNVTAINDLIKTKVLRGEGYFTILSDKGTMVAYPPDPKKTQAVKADNVEKIPDYSQIPELKEVWAKVQQGESGLLSSQGKFWAYKRMPSTNWIMLAAVPESVVLGPVLLSTIGGTLAVTAVLAAIVALYVSWLNRRLQPILNECNQLATTNAATQTLMENQDEIGRLSTSFFNLLDQVAANEQRVREEVARTVQAQEELKQASETQKESEALQAEVGHILDVVSAVEDGDLTVQAEVSDRATGLVADTLNRTIEQLSRVMATVLSNAQQVTQGAESLEHLAVTTAQQAQQQAQSVVQVQSLMQEVNSLSQGNAEQSVAANAAVRQAQAAVTEGEQQMTEMTAGIATLQDGTDQIVRRVQSLTDFVDLTSQVAKDQKRVAALTRTLALNASLLSNRASEQQDPEQFASVVREFETIATQVNDLAVQANQSLVLLQQRTDQMQTVVSGLKQDVQEIYQLVNGFTMGVGNSRQVFENIKTVTEQVAQVEERVNQSSQAIAGAAQNTLQSIQDIATVALDTERQASFTREQSGSMGELARNLLDLVQFFRVPANQLPPEPHTPALIPATEVSSVRV
ncbi:MAG: methyl-accepting chemotaxis protein [Cyanosarcina radialis HA8281-LM2]|jgi:twitching motility protein PilJ|nr:methyl-accepting chemotaxis protein [Cyanosarcina radialis HA8281-LM2]